MLDGDRMHSGLGEACFDLQMASWVCGVDRLSACGLDVVDLLVQEFLGLSGLC